MNERLEELLAQSRAECIGYGTKPATTVGYDELQRFAELIVEQCVNMCHDQALVESERGSVASVHKERALDEMGIKIAKHFGVRT